MFLLPGAFYHYEVYKDILSEIRPAVFYDGLNCCKWNGGRNNVQGNDFVNEIANSYYANNHRLALTFSNYEIDLNDTTGNYLLECLSEKDNSIIVVNNNLISYIRKHFPIYKLIYSITGIPLEYDRSFYSSVLGICDYVVIRNHHMYKIAQDFSEYIDRFEIMLNNPCYTECKHFHEHYLLVADENRNGKIYNSYYTNTLECLYNKTIDRSVSIYDKNIESTFRRAIQLGYQRFKLSGREFTKDWLIHNIKEIRQYL